MSLAKERLFKFDHNFDSHGQSTHGNLYKVMYKTSPKASRKASTLVPLNHGGAKRAFSDDNMLNYKQNEQTSRLEAGNFNHPAFWHLSPLPGASTFCLGSYSLRNFVNLPFLQCHKTSWLLPVITPYLCQVPSLKVCKIPIPFLLLRSAFFIYGVIPN